MFDLSPTAETVVYAVTAVLTAVAGIVSGFHALLFKRDPRAQLLWTILCFALPVFGAVFYWGLGVNRIRTRARKWQERGRFDSGRDAEATENARIHSVAITLPESMETLRHISRRVTDHPLVSGNAVEALKNGEEAYPAMLECIREARKYVLLCSYIFEGDKTGRRFAEALRAAADRGVDVRVIVDGVGERYGRPRISRQLEGYKGIKYERFSPFSLSHKLFRMNLRNHRKILVVDGHLGFTGGMNISDRHMVAEAGNKHSTADLHFKLCGPVVRYLEEVFAEDWVFCGGAADWAMVPICEGYGDALCRGIKDGPNEDFEKLQWILIGALSCAEREVGILTPYFIPSRELVTAIRSAVLRGTRVQIILPKKSNLLFVDWASNAMIDELLEYGVEIFHQPAPFNHSKILIIDELYVNLGSANLDPRSLRLNFEFNVEVFDEELAKQLRTHFDALREVSSPVELEALKGRHLLVRIRDSAAKVFSPYL